MFSKRILSLGILSASLLGALPASAEVVPDATDGFYCTTCHGTDGQGNVMIDAPRIAGMERWYLERQMNLFRDGLRGTHPEDLTGQEMQPMAAILDDEKLEQVLDWVEGWEYVPAEPTLTGGDVRAGRQLYQSCVACHGAAGEGREMMNAPQLAGQNDWYLVEQLKKFKNGHRGYDNADQYGSQMGLMAQQLSGEQDMIDVVSYINTLGRD